MLVRSPHCESRCDEISIGKGGAQDAAEVLRKPSPKRGVESSKSGARELRSGKNRATRFDASRATEPKDLPGRNNKDLVLFLRSKAERKAGFS